MVKATTICTVLSFVISHNWPIRQLDVHNAFLNRLLVEDVYIAQPSDFVLSQFPNYFCKLEKTLYGLKQAPRAWFQHLQDTLLKWGFQPFIVDPSMFLFWNNQHTLILLVYVNDILLIGDSISLMQSLISYLNKNFALKDLGDLH